MNIIYWICAAIYFNTNVGASPDYKYTASYRSYSRPSITLPEIVEDSRNFSVYLGYANNPFGPSKKILNYNNDNNKDRGRGNTIPSSTRQITYKAGEPFKLEYLDDNTVDSGDLQINTHEVIPTSGLSLMGARKKRGVIDLYNMVSCATGCNPLIYKGYGCYCGFLGSGRTVDGIDRCCKFHDWCYDTANCPMYLEYFVPYTWKCYRGRPLCAIHHGEWGGQGSCAQRLCECDRVLAECLSRFPCPSSRALCRSSPWRLLLQNAFML